MNTATQKSNGPRVTKLREGEKAEEAAPKVPGHHVGETLRKAREARGMTLDMVADELMIRRFYLEALEAGSFRDLPERVYATGFVRSYATHVGLEVPQVVDQFRRDAYGSRSSSYQVELVMPEPVVHSVMPGRTVILSALVVLALIGGGVMIATRQNSATVVPSIPSPPEAAANATSDIVQPDLMTEDAQETPSSASAATSVAPSVIPPQTPAPSSVTNSATSTGFDLPTTAATTTNTPAVPAANVAAGLPVPTSAANLPSTATNALPEAAAVQTPAAAVPATRLSIEALESSWVEVKDAKGVVLFTSILKKGQLLPIPDQKGITLTTGNAGGLRVTLDGQALAPLGQTNEVKRNVALDPEKFAAQQQQQ